MGFLDHLMGQAENALAAHESTLAPMVLSALGGGESQAAQSSGLSSLVGKFQQAGLGNIAESWVSNQQANKPVTPDQVHSALGEKVVSELADKTGMPKSALTAALAAMLPKLVNGLTPNGELPKTPGAAAPDQTPGEAEAPASTDGTAAADSIGQSDPTEAVQSANRQG